MPTPTPAAPETVHPLGVNGASLAYRGRYDDSVRVGAHKMVQLSLNAGGQSMVVPINVSLTRVEPAPDGTCVVWCTVNEDAQKVAVLNQLLGRTTGIGWPVTLRTTSTTSLTLKPIPFPRL
jgi:hypothetical protein